MPENASKRAGPRHVAIIMDGNGRWANRRALLRHAGHRAGVKPVRQVVEGCAEAGVEVLTLFAFSSENWQRPEEEVRGLMSLFVEALDREVEELHANGIRIKFVGDLQSLNKVLLERIDAAEHKTIQNTRMTLVIAVAYGGRWDLLRAARRLATEVGAGNLTPEQVTEEEFASGLALAGLPTLDLLIRSGGEQRISNFLLWEAAYAELYFTDVLWPDFDATELSRALAFFAGRERRFGRTSDQVGAASC
jgi:undecaprenyl diphosphate synthase